MCSTRTVGVCVGRPGSKPFEFMVNIDGTDVPIKHWPILGFMEGDLMMMHKLMMTLPHRAEKACARCAESGKNIGGSMRCVSCIIP